MFFGELKQPLGRRAQPLHHLVTLTCHRFRHSSLELGSPRAQGGQVPFDVTAAFQALDALPEAVPLGLDLGGPSFQVPRGLDLAEFNRQRGSRRSNWASAAAGDCSPRLRVTPYG